MHTKNDMNALVNVAASRCLQLIHTHPTQCLSVVVGGKQRLTEVFDCAKIALQERVCDVISGAAGNAQKSFLDASKVVDEHKGLIVGYSKRRVASKMGFSSMHSANCGPRRGSATAPSDSGVVPMSHRP